MDQSPYNAVVSIESSDGAIIYRGAGVLLAGGTHILTAAHLFNHSPNVRDITLSSQSGDLPNVKSVKLHHQWDKNSQNFNHDIAIIELYEPVTDIQGVSLSSQSNLIGQSFTFAGYGGASGFHTGTNTVDADAAQLNSIFNRDVVPGTQLAYDHDNGSESQNALGGLLGAGSATPTSNENQAHSGDSGGPLFVDGEVIGISSYAFQTAQYDVNNVVDFSAGEVGVATAVRQYIPWVESVTNGNPVYSAPTSAGEVLTSVNEPFNGSVLNYFFLELNVALTKDVTFHYKTINGTATAGEDYVPLDGYLTLKAGEKSMAIAVEILGDVVKETNETFSMQVDSFMAGDENLGIELIATHTILDNDILS